MRLGQLEKNPHLCAVVIDFLELCQQQRRHILQQAVPALVETRNRVLVEIDGLRHQRLFLEGEIVEECAQADPRLMGDHFGRHIVDAPRHDKPERRLANGIGRAHAPAGPQITRTFRHALLPLHDPSALRRASRPPLTRGSNPTCDINLLAYRANFA